MVFRKWLETRSVIPAKAGNQLRLLWIPLPREGQKDDRGEGMPQIFSDAVIFTRR